MHFRYIPILGGAVAAAAVIGSVLLAPYMPTQADLAPEETALLAEWAKVGDALAVQRMVEQGACVEALNADGTSALMTAAGEGHLDVVKMLVLHNAQVNSSNKEGDTPLHFAVQHNHPEVAAFLLEQGASVDARNKKGVTPLMMASWSGFDKLVEARTGIHTVVAENAISCVAEGTGKSLESLNAMQDGTVNLSRRRQMN